MLEYRNLEIYINFTHDKEEEILEDISKILWKHGYEWKSRETGPSACKHFIHDKVTFFPVECLDNKTIFYPE